MDIEELELTPSLLRFYRSRIHELQKEKTDSVLERLKRFEISSQERKKCESELLEYDDELYHTQQDLEDIRNALIRERRAVIELVQENAQLRGRCEYASIDSVTDKPDCASQIKRQYETLLTSLLTDQKSYLSKIRLQRDATVSKLEDLRSRCERLEAAVTEGAKELIKERSAKKLLEIRVEEMQTTIEQRILDLRRRLDGSAQRSDNTSEATRLRTENKQLRTNLEEFKDRFAIQSTTANDRISRLELELHRHKQREIEHALHSNTAFCDRIKQIERLALRYAPLQGPDVDHIFSEIEYAKDVLDGTLPPPKYSKPRRRKEK